MKHFRLSVLVVTLVAAFTVAVKPVAASYVCGQSCPMQNQCSKCATNKQQTWVCQKAQRCVDLVSGQAWCACTGGWSKWGPCGVCAY